MLTGSGRSGQHLGPLVVAASQRGREQVPGRAAVSARRTEGGASEHDRDGQRRYSDRLPTPRRWAAQETIPPRDRRAHHRAPLTTPHSAAKHSHTSGEKPRPAVARELADRFLGQLRRGGRTSEAPSDGRPERVERRSRPGSISRPSLSPRGGQDAAVSFMLSGAQISPCVREQATPLVT